MHCDTKKNGIFKISLKLVKPIMTYLRQKLVSISKVQFATVDDQSITIEICWLILYNLLPFKD